MTSKKPILKIRFMDFWTNKFDDDFIWTQILKKYYQLDFVSKPTIVFFGSHGKKNQYLDRGVPRVYCHTELVEDREEEYDFCFSDRRSQYSDNNYYHHNSISDTWCQELVSNQFSAHLLALRKKKKVKFCNFIYSNPDRLDAHVRVAFAKQLMRYKKIDCPSSVLNNMPNFDSHYSNSNWLKKKNIFVSNYKFTIAFENISLIGYCTEKLLQPLLVKSIPIYWGDKDINQKINPKAFINCHDFKDFDAVISYIIKVDNNDDLYQQYLNAPIFLKDNNPPDFLNLSQLEEKVVDVIEKVQMKETTRSIMWSTLLKVILRGMKNRVLNKSRQLLRKNKY